MGPGLIRTARATLEVDVAPSARTWLAGGLVSASLIALWSGTAVAWLVPVATTTAIIAAVVDSQTMRVPNWLTARALIVSATIAMSLVSVGELDVRDLVLGAAITAGPLLVSHLLTRGRTPGLGDVKLLGVLGVTLGAVSMKAAYAALLATLVLGAVFGVWYQRRTARRRFPLAPAIACATLGVLGATGAAERGLV